MKQCKKRKKRKTIWSLFIALSLVLGNVMMNYSVTYAQTLTAKFTLTSSKNSINVGDTVTVTVDLAFSLSFESPLVHFTLGFDESQLEYVGYNVGSKFSGATVTYADDEVTWKKEDVKDGGTLLTVTFKVIDVKKYIDDGMIRFTSLGVSREEDDPIVQKIQLEHNELSLACAHGSTFEDYYRQPTCLTSGMKQVICEECNYWLKEESIPATGHNYGDWIVVTPATVDTEGLEKRVCVNCDEEETRVIEKLDEPTTEEPTTDEPTTETPTTETPTTEAPTTETPTTEAPTTEATTSTTAPAPTQENDNTEPEPKTGDAAPIVPVVCILFVSFAGGLTLFIHRRRKL